MSVLSDRFGDPSQPAPNPDGSSWLHSFGNSFVQGLGEFVGIEKTPEQQQWDAEHPWSAGAANLTSYAVPFGVWEKTAMKSKLFSKFIAGLGNAEKAPILTKGLQEVAKFAPLEMGRLAANEVVGDRPTGEMAGSALFDLGTIGVLSGLGQGLVEYGAKRRKLTDLVPDASPDLPPQLQMRAAREYLASNPELPEETISTIKNRLSEFEKLVRLEEVAPGFKYVGGVENSSGKDINRLFDVSRDSSDISRKLFISGGRGFKGEYADGALTKTSGQKIDEFWGKTGFSPLREELPFMQFPRFIQANSNRGAGFVQGAVSRDMSSIGDGLWMAREKNNGLFVMAKKVQQAAESGKAAKGDQWLLFKTDNPGRFAPVEEAWAKAVVDKTKWTTEAEKVFKPTGSRMYDFAEKVTQQFPMLNYIGAGSRSGKIASSAEELAVKMGLDKVAGAQQAFGDFFNRYFTPASFQFTKSPRANWINGMSRAIYDEADKATHELMYGKHVLPEGNLYKASLAGTKGVEGASVKAALDKLTQSDLGEVWRAWNSQLTPAQVAEAFSQGKLSQASKDFLGHMTQADSDMIAQIQTTQAAYGQELFRPMKNHYMIARTWNGNWRVPIHNSEGQLIYMAAGQTKNQAEKMAQKILSEGVDRGWSAKAPLLADSATESPIQLASYFNDMAMNRPEYFEAAKAAEKVFETRRPGFMDERKGISGYAAEKAPWTKEELEKTILNHIRQQNRYMAKLVVNERFGVDRARLLAEDPAMFQTLEERLNDLSGKQGPLAEIQNKLVDKVLAPVLGPNSASKIASVSNSLMMHFNLGALTIAQPLMNLLTFTQTVIPEISFVMGAVPERIAPYYGVWPVAGSNGLVRGGMSVLDPLVMMKKSFAEMGKPSKMLFAQFERAANEGVVAPRMVEDYIGEGAAKVMDLKRALSSAGGFASWLKTLSETLLSGTEKLSRGNAFTVGHILGRDFLQLQDEQLYQFAKRFTQRTMYNYGTADRARVFTTPVGSMMGLFKNWMMHFMGTMLQYTGEGLTQGNWAPLLWQTAGVGAVGGVAATPLYYVADKFSHMANDKSLMDNIYELSGGVNHTSDALFFGLPALLGMSFSSNVAAPFSNPARDITQLFSFVHMDRMSAISKAVGGAFDQYEATGKNPVDNETVRLQLARAFLPKTIFRTAAAWEDKAIRSLSTGNIQLKDATPVERMMYMAGINPVALDRQFRVADELWNDQQKMKDAVKAAGNAFADAEKSGDKYLMNQIMLKSMADGMDFSRVLRSAHARDQKDNQDALERKFNPQKIWEKRHMIEQR